MHFSGVNTPPGSGRPHGREVFRPDRACGLKEPPNRFRSDRPVDLKSYFRHTLRALSIWRLNIESLSALSFSLLYKDKNFNLLC